MIIACHITPQEPTGYESLIRLGFTILSGGVSGATVVHCGWGVAKVWLEPRQCVRQALREQLQVSPHHDQNGRVVVQGVVGNE